MQAEILPSSAAAGGRRTDLEARAAAFGCKLLVCVATSGQHQSVLTNEWATACPDGELAAEPCRLLTLSLRSKQWVFCGMQLRSCANVGCTRVSAPRGSVQTFLFLIHEHHWCCGRLGSAPFLRNARRLREPLL